MFSELLSLYRERLRASGGAQNDVARAAAYVIANSYAVFYDRPAPSQAEFDGLRKQLETALASSPAFQRKTDRERQIEFEMYAILGTAVLPVPEIPRPQLVKLARENLLAVLGEVPDGLVITERGMTHRSKSLSRP